ncbi:hypothetical protein [Marinobacter sp. OP 3.4]|uniref:hypothetical protein n=1 Tax=Marinobacter sp. OP 3.4 TaxID=3076501 RepID=UPI002E230F41
MVIEKIARAILNVQSPFVTRVAIDGVDGAGKTMFGDELGRTLEALGATVIRASVDGFHHPRAVRYRRGRYSPEGFYRDSYDYAMLKQVLLDPLSPGGSGQYVSAVFDHRSDAPIHPGTRQADVGDILIFDGIFAHRPELRGYWDLSVFLEVSFETSIRRLGARDGTPMDPLAPLNRRYIEGQQLYLQECGPANHATVVVDNNELASPCIGSTVAKTESPF